MSDIRYSRYFIKLFVVIIFSLCTSNIICVDSMTLNSSSYDVQAFQPAVATWYGDRTGGGSGGACGFDDNTINSPYKGLTAAGNRNLFKFGKGCGNCYQVRCNSNSACSGFPITVVITNECPGSCNNEPFHFDLSGKAFGFLAKRGQSNALLNAGIINVQFQRVPCRFTQGMVVKIDTGSNQFFLSFAVEFLNGDGDIGEMFLIPSNSRGLVMKQSFGGTWKTGIPSGVKGPYSVTITTIESRQKLFAKNAIPANWVPGAHYQTTANIHA